MSGSDTHEDVSGDQRDTALPAPDVLVVGSGVAGLTAAVFTARAGLDTLVVDSTGRNPAGSQTGGDDGESILRRNAHLENVPGFPAGVNARQFLDLLTEQAEESGAAFLAGRVTGLEPDDDRAHAVRVERPGGAADPAGEELVLTAPAVVAASWSDASYLEDTGVALLERGSKTYVETDDCGRTGVEGVYAAGRLAAKAHQTVVCAGHGAEVGLAVVEDSEVPFYHDWVVPEGYFTERGREVPPGCEELSAEEWEARARASRERMREAFAEPHPEEPTMHPSVVAQRERDEES
jgi:thioredoxin reductase (NADPH)